MRTVLELGGRISMLGFPNMMDISNMTTIILSAKSRGQVTVLEN